MKKILLINGSQVLMDITKRILERAGYAVRCAIGVGGAKEILADYSPDGIVMECDLPDSNGLEFCVELRSKYLVPIMFLSNDKGDELLSLLAGATDFLKKPFDYDIMTTRLGVMLNSKAKPIHAAAHDDRQAAKSESSKKSSDPDPSVPMAGKVSRLRNVYLASAVCVIFALIGVGAFHVYGNIMNSVSNPSGDLVEVEDDYVPYSRPGFLFVDDTAKPYLGEERGIIMPAVNDVTLPAGERDVTLPLINPEGNDHYLSFEIVLTEGEAEQTIYRSDLIEPGMYVEEITLDKDLTKGVHSAILRIRAYLPECLTAIGSADMTLSIKAD